MSATANASQWRVLLLDTKRSNPNHYICLAIEEALRSHPRVSAVYKAQLGDAIATARQQDCNLFFAFDGEELHATVCARLRQVCGKSVLWVTEDPYELPVNLRNAELFDLVFTNDYASASAYGDRGMHMPLAASLSMQYRPVLDDLQCRYDLFFAGTAWPNRVELFRTLLQGTDGLSMKLALSENPHLPKINIGMPRSAYAWRTPHPEFCRFANASRVVLSLHRDFSTSPGARTMATTPGPRLFEVAMAGGFQLVDGSLPEVARYFEPDKEIVTFNGPEDCLEKLRHYLAHPRERVAIAQAAQRRAIAQHTYAQRIDSIMKSIDATGPRRNLPATTTTKQLPRVLMVTHNMIGQSSWGGIEVYQDIIRQSIGEKFECWFYVPDEQSAGRSCSLWNHRRELVERFQFAEASGDMLLSSRSREEVFSRLLLRHGITLVHFQHLLMHAASLPIVARALGVHTVLSLHDYYGLCRNFNLVGWNGQYCGVEDQPESGCNVCLETVLGAGSGSQASRRSYMRRIFERIDVLHANTQGVLARYQSVYGTLKKHPGLEVMGVPINLLKAKPVHATTSERLQVALLGNFTQNKGADFLLKVFAEMSTAPVDFVIFGRIDTQYQDGRLNLPNVKIHGSYKQHDLPGVLEGMDISLHASIWPETYCLTLSEAWLSGLVPVVADIGALGERVRDGENGFKFPPAHVGRLVELLLSLQFNRDLMKSVRGKELPGDIAGKDAHMAWLEGIYSRLLHKTAIYEECEQPQALTAEDCGVFLNSPAWINHCSPIKMSVASLPLYSTLRRSLRFLLNHGMRATAFRILGEVRLRLSRRAE
jgi:spore maturation protein CgeB/glycosyltransferase involved in cell wall biosynthesis